MIPLMRPRPPRLSEAAALLRQIEDSGVFSNFGPVNTRFEDEATEKLFGGVGACLTVCNATIGLMLAMRMVTEGRTARQKYALMPSFTFAAAAQAALWSGFTPLLCDIDPQNWAADAGAEEAMLRQYRGEIAVVVPYATFGYSIDLARYEQLQARHGVPVVVDAAASLGTSRFGRGFGTGFSGPIVFSMHATKSFATGEGGLIYSADRDKIGRLRAMSSFGFGQPRTATMPGLNAKLSEVGALMALLRLQDYDSAILARETLMAQYRNSVPELTFQATGGGRQAHQFVPALLPRNLAPLREDLKNLMGASGVGIGSYFSPHLAEQAYFAETCRFGDLSVTRDVASRMISLPLYDAMQPGDVEEVASVLKSAMRLLHPGLTSPADPPSPEALGVPLAVLASLGPVSAADTRAVSAGY